MAVSPKTFLRFVADHVELVAEIFERGEVDEAEIQALIARYRNEHHPAVEHMRQQLEQLGVVQRVPHAEMVFELAQPVSDLFAWLFKRQRLSSAQVLQGHLDEIGSIGRDIDEAIESGNASAAAVALNDLDAIVERVRALSEANRESIITESQRLRSAPTMASAVERFHDVRRLWERYVEPLRQLVAVRGVMEQSLDRIRILLDAGEARFHAHGLLHRAFGRSAARIARLRRTAFEDHQAAVREVEPLYERLRRESRWAQGASHALKTLRASSVEALGLDRLLELVGWRRRNLLSDEKLRARLVGLAGYRPAPPPTLVPTLSLPEIPLIPRIDLHARLVRAAPVEDIMEFVLTTWPDVPLRAQLRAYGLIVGGLFGVVEPVNVSSRRCYRAAEVTIEAWPLRLAEVEA
jgi:hypothetical protein